MFKKHKTKSGTTSSNWLLSQDHPVPALEDKLPLTKDLGDLSSLPPSHQEPVRDAFIQNLCDAACYQNQSELDWFNTKKKPSYRVKKFIDFVTNHCNPNEMVWLYTRYRDVIFTMLYSTFTSEIQYLNMLPERYLSPKAGPIIDLWLPIPHIHRLMELVPRQFANGWKQMEIENMLIVLLDHGNNQDVRVLGFYTLCLYMVTMKDDYSETTTDLFTNAICLRALSYVDMPDASLIVSNIMCAIGSGIEAVDIGCGQRAIVGFRPGRASICPTLHDAENSINPQGVLAHRMIKIVLTFVAYLASLTPDLQAAYSTYIKLGVIQQCTEPFLFLDQNSETPFDLPPFAPMLAINVNELRSSMKSIYRLFCKAYLLWIYPSQEEPPRTRNVRRVPILGLRLLIDFMLNNLVPRYEYMISDMDFFVPFVEKSPHDTSKCWVERFPGMDDQTLADIQSIKVHTYDSLRYLMLDCDLDSGRFFIDILRLSLQVFSDTSSLGVPNDNFDLGLVLDTNYSVCLGSLTIVRIWLASKEEYRPVHLLTDRNDAHMLSNVIADYAEHVYGLLDWLVEDNTWDEKKIVLLYNALLVHRVALRLYRHNLPQWVKNKFMDRLQSIVIAFLKTKPKSSEDVTSPTSFANRALTILVECLILGIFGLGGQVDEMVLKLRDLYSTKTSWTNHLNVWCNVLHALTIARGRHILNVEERVLIQESMFSGQRQRKGLSKVDAYLNRMKVPTYHLEMDDLHDILGTATPFNTTSNLVWDTMRLVFDNVKSAAQKECDSAEKIASLLKESSGKTWSASSGALEHLSQTPCGIYTRIIASNPKALVQIGNNINKDILIQVQSRKTAPQRVYRMQSSRNRNAEASQHEPQTVLAPLEKAQSHNIESAKAKNKTVQRNTADVPKKPSIWHKIKQPFRKGKSSVVSAQPRDRYLESADISRSNLPPSADQNNEINSYRTSTEASRKAPDKVKTNNTRNRAALLQSPARDYDRQHMPVASWEGMSTQSRSSSMVSVTMERHIQQPHPVGPAFISAELPGTHLNVKQAYHHHSKTGLRSTSSTDSQKTEVAISNAKAAAALLGDISTRIWQLEGIWVDFHISEFVYTQNNTVKDLQKMWLVWVHLLGNPIDADETHSKIILRGMVMSWDVYRAVLDCSRYAPDNDDVMLNTSWWIAEMATIYSIDDYRGRLAQLAMFRIGCHGSDHISSRVLFLRSRFLQTALITLSTLAKDHAINIDQVQVFLVECKLVLSLGISGSQLMLLTIYRGLRRIFLYHSTYEGVFSDQAIQSAATLLVSMTTMLGVTRVLSLNHHLEKAQKLFECNMVDDAEIQGMFSNVKDGVERCEYPIIYDPLGSRQYRAEWVDGGPVFGKCCDIIWQILLDTNILSTYSDKCCIVIEHIVLSGLAVLCFNELSIKDKKLRNSRIIDNCLCALVSGLFSSRDDTVRVAISNIGLFVIGQNDLMDYIGVVWTRNLTMHIMKAIAEHFDRSAHNVTIGKAVVIREMITLLTTIIIKTPELITREDSHVEGADARSIRDFLIEKVILSCADPTSERTGNEHRFNQRLVQEYSNHGLVLKLVQAQYSTSKSMSMEEFMTKSEDEHRYSGNAIESIKQAGEVLYVTLLQQFDEFDRSRYQGAPGSDFDKTHIDPIVQEDFSSNRVYFYAHNSGILKVYSEPDSERKIVVRVHFAPENQEKYMQVDLKRKVNLPVVSINTPSKIYKGYGSTEAPIPVISSLVIDDALSQSKDIDSIDDNESNKKSFNSKGKAADKSAKSNTNIMDEVTEFVNCEMEALHGMSTQAQRNTNVSKQANGNDVEDEYAVLPLSLSSSEKGFDKLTYFDDLVRDGPISPFKLNLFRSLMQRQMITGENGFDSCYFLPLEKSESLFRDILSLDRIHANETIKIALLYVGPGQWSETEILSNTPGDTSASYRSFVAGLGWQIDLKTFPGFTGKLEDCGSDGTSCPYFADDGLELVFHEATSMPNSIKEPRQLNKKRHIGNDHVHIIWNESRHTYRPETISGDFGNVQIQIRPLKPGEYGISIYCDEQIRPFGPLVDGMVISADVLPAAVRATAISGHRRAVQAFFKTFIHPYVIRQQNINRIVEKYIDSKWLRTMFKEEEWI